MSKNAQEFQKIPDPPGKRNVPWTFSEDRTIWQHPDWTAEELHEEIPRHSVRAIAVRRSRIGRWRPDAVPLCQKCGEHPVWAETADGARWGLCRACTLEEREWRVRHAGDFSRRDNALRQAAFKGRKRAQGGR